MPWSSGALGATTRPPLQAVPAEATTPPLHIPSHLGLTRTFRKRTYLLPEYAHAFERFDAVIVPAARRGLNLEAAATVANGTARHLVVFCSHECTVTEAEAAIARVEVSIPVFVVDASELIPPLTFACEQVLADQARWEADTSLKRNAGLVLARQLGWSTALFLDDDVRDLDAVELRRAVTLLNNGQGLCGRPARIAGWNFPGFPDNSIVCHAYRELAEPTFGEQGTFIGGGGLAVRIDRRVSFFPRTYNEDWLFMYRDLLHRSVAHMGSLSQKPYDPFDRPFLAQRQEFGDVLGEGLFAALHERRRDPATAGRIKDPQHWAGVVERRCSFIDHIRGQLDVADPVRADQIRVALQHSFAAVSRIDPKALAEVVLGFEADLDAWALHLAGLELFHGKPVMHGMARSLEALNATFTCVANEPRIRQTFRQYVSRAGATKSSRTELLPDAEVVTA